MPVDILIFAVIAAFLVYRLNGLLGTRHGDERERPNPFAPRETVDGRPLDGSASVIDTTAVETETRPVVPVSMRDAIDADADKDGRVTRGLEDIAAADPRFDLAHFIHGAKTAFEWIVKAYAAGDRETLKPLLSPKLYAGFATAIDARETAGHKSDFTLHRIARARITEAHLGGTMAYITVDFDAEETVVTRDAEGRVLEGDPDRIMTVADIWTFTRDVRSDNPAWTLIETRAPAA